MRPSLPLPITMDASRSCSSSRRRTAGLSLYDVSSLSDAATDSGTAATSWTSARAAVTPASPSSSIASTSPLVTVVPSLIFISLRIPAAGAGTSSTTLSVSRSTRFSSRATASPGFLCQPTSVASVTDSGSCGTLISIVICLSSCCRQPAWTCLPLSGGPVQPQPAPVVAVNVT